jgi:hypothetical protein
MAAVHRIVSEYNSEFHKSPGLKVLDLFCCSGVGAEGYLKHTKNVLGVDIARPTFYPATFLQADIRELPLTFVQLFDFVHYSPPCQGYSDTKGLSANKQNYDLDVIPFCRDLALRSGVPSIIENVDTAPLSRDFVLCGSMFGLGVIRHRVFECVNWLPFHSGLYCDHKRFKNPIITLAGEFKGSKHAAAVAMGCYPSRTRWELKQGIPPAYCDYIFKVFMRSLTSSPASLNFSVTPSPSALSVIGNKPLPL